MSGIEHGRAARTLALLLLLAILGLAGCVKAPRDGSFVLDVEADSVRVDGAAAEARTSPDGRVYQFRAVCTEPNHPDGKLVLSKWVDDPEVARELGQYHGDWKAKGHLWHLERRTEPRAGQ